MTKNLFIYAAAVLVVCAAPITCAGDEKPLSCGTSKITVSPARMRGGEHVLQDFLVTVTQPNNTKTFKFAAENDFLQVRCETNRGGEAVLLVNHHCGGSGCAESNFSIIALASYKVLLSANERWKGNHSAAESILGKRLPPFVCGQSQNGKCIAAKFE